MSLRPILLSMPLLFVAHSVDAQTPPQPQQQQGDENLLGTLDINGLAASAPPLPKLAVMPLVTSSSHDSVLQLVVKGDLELSGQYDVVDDSVSPPGPLLRDTPVDLKFYGEKKVEIVVRVLVSSVTGGKVELLAEAYLVPPPAKKEGDAGADAADAGPPPDAPPPKPAYTTKLQTTPTDVRAASHRLVDLLLGALTGRPGSFASQMTYAKRVGKWRQVFLTDADGFNLHAYGPNGATALSPTFGPGGEVFYAWSENYSPFKLVFGPRATAVPITVPGSILGVAFSSDRTHVALTVMDQGKSQLYEGTWSTLKAVQTAPYANHPAYGPMGKIAYVAGAGQQVYVDGKPISPPGFLASAPAFCDTPQGLLVIFTVGIGAGADIIAANAGGGGFRRLTQNQGANTYPACSPDGRLVAYFSSSTARKGPGLYVMPITRPWLAKRVSTEVGEALRWEMIKN